MVNRTKGKTITERVDVANTFFSRAWGLMFRKEYDGAMVFPHVGRESFHGFFCFFPILLVCLDEQNRVKDIKLLKPWRLVPVNCETVIELDARKKWEIEKGDELSWDED
jgi:uncharacterized membrane protein (UPF0127 family)